MWLAIFSQVSKGQILVCSRVGSPEHDAESTGAGGIELGAVQSNVGLHSSFPVKVQGVCPQRPEAAGTYSDQSKKGLLIMRSLQSD